ncbi:hypothetical protein JCM19231_5345 [Vibrio ishigakensis]|uniref:Uncharacterized protein n=1 Tax=Vibrio ishigakensis TaxID=1481914 RepID=A0A0B8NNH8_9VIBR|nr:hypothetical protein JCM19231_5345 [Vibrio ishigakensis]
MRSGQIGLGAFLLFCAPLVSVFGCDSPLSTSIKPVGPWAHGYESLEREAASHA